MVFNSLKMTFRLRKFVVVVVVLCVFLFLCVFFVSVCVFVLCVLFCCISFIMQHLYVFYPE